MKKSILLLAAMCCAALASAQMGFGKIKDIEEMEGRKLIVMLEAPAKDAVNPFKKKDIREEARADYEAYVEEYNAALREVAGKHWKTGNKGIVFKTRKQVEELQKRKDRKYAVLYCTHRRPSGFRSGVALYNRLIWAGSGANQERTHASLFTEMRITLIEKFGKDSPVYLAYLANIMPEKSDLAYGMSVMNNYFQMRKANPKLKFKDVAEALAANKPRLKEKTLLLREDWIDEAFDTSQISSLYPYAYSIVSADAFNEAVANADARYAYAMIVQKVSNSKGPGSIASSQSVFYRHYLVDAADGTVLDIIESPGGKGGKGFLGISISFSKDAPGKYFDAGIAEYAD
ncbi:MAG: hypothetical protein KDD02_25390 [Phaeodactylibacter sp.]|nr:hypothetical protein [Phaeodactylibacter sp.]MCB9302398.1 hypothetical protein [Lewinellaceae bacterium]HQU58612.1 hypothetical protein [Saprospiraceae bacterium]